MGSFKLRTESWFFLNGIAFVSCDMLWDKSFWFVFFQDSFCVCVCKQFLSAICWIFSVRLFNWDGALVSWEPKRFIKLWFYCLYNYLILELFKKGKFMWNCFLGMLSCLLKSPPQRKKEKRKLALPWVNLYSKRSSQLEL